MNADDKQARQTYAAAINGAETIQGMGYLELESTAETIRTKLSGKAATSDKDKAIEQAPLHARPALIDSLVLIQKRMMALSGTDGAYAEQDHAHQNKQIVEDHLEKGDLKSALQFTQMLKDKGQEVPSVKINKEATKAHYAEINKEKEKRVPVIAEQLNIDKEQAEQWFDENESMDRWGRPSILGTQEAEPEKPEAPERPEGQMSTAP